MKRIAFLIVSVIFLSSCEETELAGHHAVIVGFNPDKAMCQYGWTLIYQNREVKCDDDIIGSEIGFEPSYPVAVIIQVNELGHTCNSMGHEDYISIDHIERN